MALRSLEDTFIYTHLNRSNGLTQNIGALLTRAPVITEENLREAFATIQSSYKFPLKNKVLDAYKNGLIVLKFSGNTTRLPTCLPFILTKSSSNQIVGIIDVAIYGRMDEDTGNVSIDPKKLYIMMEGAMLARTLYIYSKYLNTRTALINNSTAIYSAMFTKVLNKMFSLNIHKDRLHAILFLSSKFMLVNILGMDPTKTDLIYNYSIRNCTSPNHAFIETIDSTFPTEAYTSIDTFITELAKPQYRLGLQKLNVRTYMEAFINMYDSATLLALESYPYFVYNVLGVTSGAYINNQYTLEDVVGVYGAKLYADIVNIDRN